ncbi:MAG: glycosyltransferase [Deltaproteobacteria bacterium]|nr:glycosyltransferase [Deltaproteobacteria bacterium]
MIKISIITPSYNQGKFIEETIKSILSQEGRFFIEYIIMDGGSKDNSVDVIKKYERLLKEGKWEIKCLGIDYFWVSEKDKGQVDAIEKGFARAKGEIGAWLNSDDVYHDSKVLQRVADEFSSDPELKMVTGDGNFIDRGGCEFGLHEVERLDFTELIYLDYHILQPATFVRKEIYKSERIERSYNYCFDAEYFIRLINKGYKFRKIKSLLASFRIYPEIKTLSGQEKSYSEFLGIIKKYGNKPYHIYLISVFYKYWSMVLKNKYPKVRLIQLSAYALRICAYKLILGKVR